MSFGHDIAALVADFERGLLAKHPGWPRVKLSEVADLLNGFPYESMHFSDVSGIPLLRIRDILPGRTETYYRGPLDDPRMFKVRNGDLVVGMDGDFNARIWQGGEALLNQRVCVLRAREALYSQKFLAHLLPGYLKLINDNTSSVTVKHLSSKTVQDTPLPLPPLAEQRRIVSRVNALFAEIAEGEAALAATREGLDTFRRALLKAAVTGELTKEWRADNPTTETGHDLLTRIVKERATKDQTKGRGRRNGDVTPLETSLLPPLPGHWTYATLGELFDVSTGSTPSRSDPTLWNGGIPWVSSGEVAFCRIRSTRETITTAGLGNVATRLNPIGTVLLAMIGEGKTRGQCAILDVAAANNQNAAAIRVSATLIPPEFVYEVLEERYFRSRRESQGGNQPALNGGKVAEMAIPLPPLNEISEILFRLSEARSASADTLAMLDAEAADAARLRQSILKAAFEGRLVPQDPADEPASALLARMATNPVAPRAGRGRPNRADEA